MSCFRVCVLSALIVTMTWPVTAAAQDPPATQTPPVDDDPDRDINTSQPDFTLITLPTTLRLPKYKSAFRVTHRFTQSLADGDFGDQFGSLFGLDASASIGLEFRFGLLPGLQAGVFRTNSNKTINNVFCMFLAISVSTCLHNSLPTCSTRSCRLHPTATLRRR